MLRRIIPLLFFLSFINAQIALPTFQGVHKPHTAAASSSLYNFTSQTFTNCGATGRNGPTLSNCTGDANYTDSWTDNTSYFNVPNDAGIQNWTVPTTGTYTIEAWGAKGTDSGDNGSGDGGRGVKIKGDFSLTSGQILKIIVGQVGLEAPYESGGGGGSYVYSNANDSYPLIAAGGGGGGGRIGDGTDGNTSTSGGSGGGTGGSGGSNGNGGDNTGHANYSAAAGAGWLTDGEDGLDARNETWMATAGGHSPRNDGTGGDNASRNNADGGFGGGGAAFGYNYYGGGGGGGFSGGGAGSQGSYGGGGGGSYNSGSNQYDSSTLGYNTSDGKVVITIN